MFQQQETLIAFILTSTIACLIPGPAVIYVVTHTISKGMRSGLSAIWGLQIGFLIQVFAATCGLSALILKSALAFSILKSIGALYLIYLGLTLLFRKKSGDTNIIPSFRYKPKSSFTHGVLINALNPKIAIFFISYIPQFIKESSSSPVGQILFFGLVFCILGTITNIAYALSVKTAVKNISTMYQSSIFRRWLPGSIFLGFGLKLAFYDRQ